MPSNGVVVITGASTGIGRASAVALDKLGYRVFAGVRNERAAAELKALMSDRLMPIVVDVVNGDHIRHAVEIVTSAIGNDRFVGLFNNAGITVNGPLEFVPLDEIRRQLEVNLIGTIAVTQAFLPLLRQHRGRIVSTGSIGGIFVTPMLGPYCMSKFGMEAMSDAWRVELRPWGIHVALLEPGAIATPIWEKGLSEADKFTDSAPKEMQALYGPLIGGIQRLAMTAAKNAIPPERVADALVHALTSSRPKARYLIGAETRVQKAITRLLPWRWRDALVARFVGVK